MHLKALFDPPKTDLKKALLIMKITAIILLTTMLQASATGHSQTVTLSVSNTSLEKIFQVPRFDPNKSSNIMVVVEADGSRVALLVDELLGQHQVVVKNLESNYRKVPNVSGATILGDGTVALILDTGGLVRRARH